MNDGLSLGSLAVDGNKGFLATHDGKMWMYEDTTMISGVNEILEGEVTIFPNPASEYIELTWTQEIGVVGDEVAIFNMLGQPMQRVTDFDEICCRISITHLLPRMYWVLVTRQDKVVGANRLLIQE